MPIIEYKETNLRKGMKTDWQCSWSDRKCHLWQGKSISKCISSLKKLYDVHTLEYCHKIRLQQKQ